jgi:hypothetical protein
MVALVARMVSDGCPRQRTSETFPISRTEFKKSFLWQQAQPIVILSMGSQPYGMAVFLTLTLNSYFLTLTS